MCIKDNTNLYAGGREVFKGIIFKGKRNKQKHTIMALKYTFGVRDEKAFLNICISYFLTNLSFSESLLLHVH